MSMYEEIEAQTDNELADIYKAWSLELARMDANQSAYTQKDMNHAMDVVRICRDEIEKRKNC